MKNIYVGNLPYTTTENEISELFGQYGKVTSVKLVIDRETNHSKGFGFVLMNDADAILAISELDGQQFGGRRIRVNEARERTERESHRIIPPDRPPRRFDAKKKFREE